MNVLTFGPTLTTTLVLTLNAGLLLTRFQAAQAEDYEALITDGSDSTIGMAAQLQATPSFTKITSGRVVTDAGSWTACAWGDYDGDGFLDLFITSSSDANGSLQSNALYRNNGNGTFTRITASAIVGELGDWRACSWADYNNDGYLDLVFTRVDTAGFPDQALLYRNNGNGTFTKMTANILGKTLAGGHSEGCVWGDYDNDGYIDLYVARYGNDWLLHNNGDGMLTKLPNNLGIPPDNQDSYSAMWGDYDGDGRSDLFVAVKDDAGTNQNNFLYHNDRDGLFTKITAGAVVTDNEYSGSGTWVDYDNDGYLDLFVVNSGLLVSGTNSLYHNNGDGSFRKKTSSEVGSIVADSANFAICSWGDYDNDGFLDLFITNGNDGANFLYHNNGDGSFTRIPSGSLVSDKGPALGCAWADYDNDGFLDLIVARGAHGRANNLLYHNDRNSNSWLKIKLIGTVSNRSAIGAKARMNATIGGRAVWQLREVTAGNGFSPTPLECHFGLGDATNVDLLRIEWPSGTVQEFHDLAPSRSLAITEPPRLLATATDGIPHFSLKGGRGFQYDLQASTKLADWSPVATVTITNLNGIAQITDTNTPGSGWRFYRAVSRQ